MSDTAFKFGYIAIIGRPNVGKSTLSNELMGQKVVITSHKAQTTRHKIQLIDTTQTYQMVLLDTPGMHLGETKALNTYMNRAASSSVEGVDIIIWMVEADRFTKEDEKVLETLKHSETKVFIFVNKIDRVADKSKLITILQTLQDLLPSGELVPLSCYDAKDIKKVKQLIISALPQGEALFSSEYITTHNERFMFAEFIREKLMRNLANEIPYNTTVTIDRSYVKNDIQYIYATIYIVKHSQKTILIGKNGAMLKKISTDARKTIEGFLDSKVYLNLWVKTKENWTDNNRDLIEFGYT